MLRNVLIISDAGLVLFSKEFISAVGQPRLVGSLLTAMLEFSTNNVGAPVCYIEMTNVAVSICSSRPPESPGFFAPFGTSASVSSAQTSAAQPASHASQLNTSNSHGSLPHTSGVSPEKPPPAARHKSDSLHKSESHPSSTSTTPQVPHPPSPSSLPCHTTPFRRKTTATAEPPWRQPRGKSMVSLVNSPTHVTTIGWQLWEIDLRFAPGFPPG